MKRPDRFERMVNNQCGFEDVTGDEFWVSREVAVGLLRAEHAWMRRMVRAVGKEYTSSDGQSSAENLMLDILERLDKRRK